MLLGNAHIEIAFRKALFKLDHARAFAHGGRDTDQAFVFLSHVAQPLTEHLGEAGLGRRAGLDQAHGRVKLAGCGVVAHRVGLGQLVAVAFAGDDVQELRAFQVTQVLQRGNQRLHVMAVNRPDIVEAEFLEDRAGHDHALGVLFKAPRQLKQGRRVLKHGLGGVTRCGVELAAHQARQVAVERPDRRRDRHVVVVQDDQHIRVGHPGIVQRLERHAGAHCTITNDRHCLAVFTLQLGGHRHAVRCRN